MTTELDILLSKRSKTLKKLNSFLDAIKIILKEDNQNELKLVLQRKSSELNIYAQITDKINEELKKTSNILTTVENKIKTQEEQWQQYLAKEKTIIIAYDNVLKKMQETSKKINLSKKIRSTYL